MPAMPAMPTPRRIFLSMVSDEFRACRALLTQDLERAGVDVATQEKWGTLGATTLAKLDTYLQACDAVIHVLGDALGHLPPAAAVDALLARYPGFVAHFSQHIGFGAKLLAGVSYTQWEAYLALFHQRPLHLYRPAAGAPREPGWVAHPPQQALQAEHWQRLCALGRDWGEFLNAERLSSHVLGDLNSLLPPRAATTVQVAPTRLTHSAAVLVGREAELALLDQAWSNPSTHVVVIRGKGGEGKTSLVAAWMAELACKGWRGAQRVLDWSFYSQGTKDQSSATADFFFDRVLSDLGDPDPKAGGPEDRAARLADLLNQQRTLLVLDGLEPLQHPPGPLHGALKDKGMAALLRALAARNTGLVVVTTRERVDEIQPFYDRTAIDLDLQFLSPLAGAQVLHNAGARRAGSASIAADDAELQAASGEVKGHALTLFLVGNYLLLIDDSGRRQGDIRQRHTMRLADAEHEYQNDSRRAYGHAFKAIEAYETWFAAGDESARLQLSVLRLLGLFDRPAKAAALAALRQPPIPGLTELWPGQTDRQWRITLARLQEIRLIDAAPDGSIDAHPLIREYFGQQLRSRQPQAFQAAHGRLFDHLCQSTPHRPDTLDGLQPLYQAVVHGCLAGRQQEACDKVYIDRILRGGGADGFYSRTKLGAIGADLGAEAAFFEQTWTRVSANLSEGDQAWLLSEAAFSLHALGRITEALEPMRAGLEKRIRQANWKNAANGAGNLSGLEVTLGRLGEAVADARRAIEFADRSGDAFKQMGLRTTAADALHQSGQAGQQDEARVLFATAEAMQHKRQPGFELLYSLQGFRYCDLILAPAERAAWAAALGSGSGALSGEVADALADAERRGNKMFDWRVAGDPLLDIALDHLTLARVALYRAALAGQPPAANANPHLAPALDSLRQAGQSDHLPKALLTAAHWQALAGDAAAARRHLDEAQQIAARGPMPLYLADVHLHRARLFGDPSELALALALIEKHGYGRRRAELGDARRAAQAW